jgi:chromosome segregation ATPase
MAQIQQIDQTILPKHLQALEKLQRERQGLETETMALRHQKTGYNARLKLPTTLQAKCKQITDQIAQVQKQLNRRDEDEKRVRVREYEDCVTQYLQVIKSLVERTEALSEARVMRGTVLQRVRAYLQQRIDEKDLVLQGYARQSESKKRSLKESERNQTNRAREAREKEQALEAIVQERYGGPDHFLEVIYPQILQVCPEDDFESISVRIAELNVEIKSIFDDPSLLGRYEALVQELSLVQQEHHRLNEDLLGYEMNLAPRMERWLLLVRSLTDKLNQAFALYMSQLGYRGEVTLREQGKLSQYEIVLRVSYRRESNLVELSGCRHSGGERAVATIMYLMSLQDMTTSPFRVVDEINQGMDERNERLVIDRIVHSCCDFPSDNTLSASSAGSAGSVHVNVSEKPQYFLITPKLLPALISLRHPDVTILLIWNGPGVLHKWQFSSLVALLLSKASSAGSVPPPPTAAAAAGETVSRRDAASNLFADTTTNPSGRKKRERMRTQEEESDDVFIDQEDEIKRVRRRVPGMSSSNTAEVA